MTPHPHRPPSRVPRRVPAPIVALVLLSIVAAGCDQGRTVFGSSPASAAQTPAPSGSGAPAGSPSLAAPSGSVSGAPPASSPAGAFDPSGVQVSVETVVGGLDAPLAIANAGDASNRLFVVQQGGQVLIVRDGALVAAPFLDIADRITAGGERGLLGFAVHPDFPDDPRVFVDYTDDQGDTRVSSFRVDPARPDQVDVSSEQRLLFVKQPFANHNGGAIAFGPDRFLYVSLGDGGSGGDPQGNGQSLGSRLGKILRIDTDGTTGDLAYRIPPDNPYAAGADGQQPEIWLWGLRNPWRMSFDRTTGDLWIGDVGQGEWEEIDVLRAGVPGGTNFGWNVKEGTHCYQTGCEGPALTDPVTEYGHDEGCTVIGGNVYRGTAQAALVGGYVFGDYCTGRLWAIDPATNAFRAPTVVGEMGAGLSAFGEDEAGELYATDINGGRLLRVVATKR